jgi:iron complex outermembrane recepter protein
MMKIRKLITLSLVCACALSAKEIELNTVNVQSQAISGAAVQNINSDDLADILQQAIPTISLTRRSGTSNDIILRGMRKDDINVLVDGTKTYGACPNRMDPPISHVSPNNIQSVQVIDGPYDVENFGTLSGAVKVVTKKPQKGLNGKFDLGIGSYAYKNAGVTLSGGNDVIRMLVSGSIQTSAQYADGQGDTLAQQTKNNAPSANQYQSQYFSKNSYERKDLTAKAFVNITKNQDLELSYTAGRGNDILYPSTAMDAIFDNSNLYDVKYNLKNLGTLSKKITLQYYQSDVDHLMTNQFRNNANMMLMANHLKTKVQGIKLSNAMDILSNTLTLGVDASKRNWDGALSKNGTFMYEDIPNVDTYDNAIFAKLGKTMGAFSYNLGVRYDAAKIQTPFYDTRHYDSLNGYIRTGYKITNHNKITFGLGKSSRVPDGKELYFAKSPTMVYGNHNLNQVSNYEADLGLQNSYDSFMFKTKLFYSKLKNYIIYDAKVAMHNYQNIDASIYGIAMNGSYYITDKLTMDAGAAYQRGRKDTFATGQTDRNLPNIAPLKGNLALQYTYQHNSYIKAEVVASDAWSRYDSDDGEQAIGGWSVLNLKASHEFNKYVSLTAGINNVANTTYAISNTYKDLSLLSGGGDVMLLNEPGRYFYANLTLKY